MIKLRSSYKKTIPYIFLALLYLILHWNMSLSISDDAVFKEILNNKSLFEHIRWLYMDSNGKIFPDTMAAIFTYINPWIWKCLDIFMYVTIAACINKLFAGNLETSLPGCLVTLLIPLSILNSAGWVATSTNYIWSSAALLVALLPLKYVDQFKDKKWLYVVCILGNIYAGNQEQAGAILITLYVIYIVLRKYNRLPVHKYIWISFATAALGLIVIFMAPGHIKRSSLYTRFNVPDFIQLSFFDKLVRGFTSTAAYFLSGNNVIWPLFCFLLFLLVLRYSKNRLEKVISAVPFIYSLVFGLFQDFLLPDQLKSLFSYYPEWGYSLPEYQYISAFTYTEWKYYLPILFSIIIIGIIYLSMLWLWQSGFGGGGILFLAFSAGLCSRLIMGFASTLYGSSFRTFAFFYFALEICIVIVLNDLIQKSKRYAIPGSIGLVLAVCSTFYTSYCSIM